MSTLIFDPARCVRSVSKFSACNGCVEACPVETIRIAENGLPSFVPSICVDCGGCLGVCPNEALRLKNFDATEFFFEFGESEEDTLSCRVNLPCLAALSVDHLLSLALVKSTPLVMDMGHCERCPYKEPLVQIITDHIEEANYLLEAIESDKRIEAKNLALQEPDRPQEGYDPDDRRAFLERLSLKGAIKSRREFEEAIEAASSDAKTHTLDLSALAKLRQKELPDKRKILFVALKRANKPEAYHTIAQEDISIASQKFIDMELCTACQMCYRICPTGALSSDASHSRIMFDAMMCIKCRACHDTCESDALQLQPTFEIKEFFEPTQRLLAKFAIKRCNECGQSFTSIHGEAICPRCAVEEEEALDLWGLEEREGVVRFKEGEERELGEWRKDTDQSVDWEALLSQKGNQ